MTEFARIAALVDWRSPIRCRRRRRRRTPPTSATLIELRNARRAPRRAAHDYVRRHAEAACCRTGRTRPTGGIDRVRSPASTASSSASRSCTSSARGRVATARRHRTCACARTVGARASAREARPFLEARDRASDGRATSSRAGREHPPTRRESASTPRPGSGRIPPTERRRASWCGTGFSLEQVVPHQHARPRPASARRRRARCRRRRSTAAAAGLPLRVVGRADARRVHRRLRVDEVADVDRCARRARSTSTRRSGMPIGCDALDAKRRSTAGSRRSRRRARSTSRSGRLVAFTELTRRVPGTPHVAHQDDTLVLQRASRPPARHAREGREPARAARELLPEVAARRDVQRRGEPAACSPSTRRWASRPRCYAGEWQKRLADLGRRRLAGSAGRSGSTGS